MFTPSKPKGANFIDVTLLNTPQPQATSTVQRKSTLESKYLENDVNEARCKQPATRKSDGIQKSEESSLGILDNISSFLAEVTEMGEPERLNENKQDTERELARRLLQRCSDIKGTSIYDTNKENNANIQNLSGNITPLIRTDQGSSMCSNQSDCPNENTMHASINKPGSVVFEPNEISARSSGLSRSSEKRLSSASNKNVNTITFDTTTAELMAQFNNEEFRPASEMASQMLADEISWQQNYSYALPTSVSAEKEYLNLSCFSGIIGELDLSVESCAGRKMSVDEFFRRKCGNFGELSDDAVERPSLGLSVDSPKKKGQMIPLVDSTMMTEASSVASFSVKDKTRTNISCTTKDIEEQSIMSLSSIAQALQNIDSDTPRRLVDQLIMAKKKRKPKMEEANVTTDTYTLMPSGRKSMPVTPSRSIDNFEKDMELLNLSAKLSLDSKITNESTDVKHTIPRMLSYESNVGAKTSFKNACQELKKEISNGNLTSSYNKDYKALLEESKLSLSHCNVDKQLSPRTSKISAVLNQEKKSSNMKNEEIGKKELIKEENISYKDKSENTIQDISNKQGIQAQLNNVVIGRNTDELCNCIVGMPRETDIELVNKSDRWVICSLSVHQVQGDKHNVRLTLPKDVILIKPNAEQHAKIAVIVVKMCKPIIAVLNITVSDMVTRSEWTMKHIICFKPEEINISVSSPSQTFELDFQCIVENSTAVLPVTIKNKNNVDVPIRLSVPQGDPSVFSLDNCEESHRVILKPQEVLTANVRCKGVSQRAAERSLQRYSGNLFIHAENGPDDIILIKEVPLVVQVGTCKLQVIDTDLPLIVPSKQSKPLTVVNVGSMPITISSSFVQDSEFAKNAKYFSVQPDNLFLKPNETGCFFVTYKQQHLDAAKVHAKIKLTVANNAYHYSIIGESNFATDAENENYPRCETPQYLSSVSSPSSPHSVISNKSGISGRNSPISSVSGSTVVGDKIPIRTTHAALVWNSLKAGKSDIKEFTIRNTSNNKIRIQAVISDNDKNFRFLRERQAAGTTIVLVLQGSESRTLSVMFSPHHLGAATGKIIFRHFEPKREDNESRPSKVLFLYGYGGYSKVEISEAFKDTSGKMWLSLGTLNSGGSLNARLKLQNVGDLCSYVKIKLTPKAVYPTMVSSWHINPTELLLNPKEVQWVTLEFQPRKEDLILLQRSDVSHVGTILITHGDEPSRWRIRRLYNKMKETGELNGSENDAFRNIVHPICRAFPGEHLTSDISAIRDSVQNLGDLCRGIRQHEIMLTMEMCADETLSVLHDNADESQMFYSLCSDNSHIYDGNGESFLPSDTLIGNRTFQHYIDTADFIVTPTTVILTPPTRTEAIVTIKTSCAVAQPFETALSNTEYLSVVPTEGMIPTRRDFQLKIQCKKKIERNLNAILEIYTENNKLDVQIRVNVKRL